MKTFTQFIVEEDQKTFFSKDKRMKANVIKLHTGRVRVQYFEKSSSLKADDVKDFDSFKWAKASVDNFFSVSNYYYDSELR